MTRTEKGVEDFARLANALRETTTPCRDDWRFIQERDQLDSTDLNEMRTGCGQCPLAALCGAYAEAARPSAGLWAGRFWGRRERPSTPGGSER